MAGVLDITILVIPLHMEKTQKRYVYKPLDGSTDAVHLEGLPSEINMEIPFYFPMSFFFSRVLPLIKTEHEAKSTLRIYFRLLPKAIWGS